MFDDAPPPDLGLTCFHIGECELLVLTHAVEASAPTLADQLTRAQRETLLLALDGLSNVEIAARRGLSPGTIAKHLATAYRRLGVSTRAEAALVLTRRVNPSSGR